MIVSTMVPQIPVCARVECVTFVTQLHTKGGAGRCLSAVRGKLVLASLARAEQF
jgi:hypothetical protein